MLRNIIQPSVILIFIFYFMSNIIAENKIDHKIAVLVNDNVITSYDIIQRLKLIAIINGNNINIQNNQAMLNNIVDELIQEKVKIDKINEYNIKIDEIEYNEFELNFFKNNNIDRSQILSLLSKNNINYEELKNLLKYELSWNKLIRGLFLRLTSVSELEIDEIISKNPDISPQQAQSLVIKRQLDLQSSKLLRDIMNEATIDYK